jgi:hypothetical protein
LLQCNKRARGAVGTTGPAGVTIWKLGTGYTGYTGPTGVTGPPGYSNPYAWGITEPIGQSGPTGTVSFNFNGSSWNLNSYFTFKYGIIRI